MWYNERAWNVLWTLAAVGVVTSLGIGGALVALLLMTPTLLFGAGLTAFLLAAKIGAGIGVIGGTVWMWVLLRR